MISMRQTRRIYKDLRLHLRSKHTKRRTKAKPFEIARKLRGRTGPGNGLRPRAARARRETSASDHRPHPLARFPVSLPARRLRCEFFRGDRALPAHRLQRQRRTQHGFGLRMQMRNCISAHGLPHRALTSSSGLAAMATWPKRGNLLTHGNDQVLSSS